MKENKIVWRASFDNGVVMERERTPNKRSFWEILDKFQYEAHQENTHGKLERFDENNQVIYTIGI